MNTFTVTSIAVRFRAFLICVTDQNQMNQLKLLNKHKKRKQNE
jgi:hypothetical protein